jgi:ferredoxin
MNSIDFSETPPVIHNNCEGCDVCWCVCPEDAVEFPDHQAAHVIDISNYPFARTLERLKATGKFRQLVPEDQIGWDYPIHSNPNVPRMVFKEDDEWPEMRDKSGNVIRNHYD